MPWKKVNSEYIIKAGISSLRGKKAFTLKIYFLYSFLLLTTRKDFSFKDALDIK